MPKTARDHPARVKEVTGGSDRQPPPGNLLQKQLLLRERGLVQQLHSICCWSRVCSNWIIMFGVTMGMVTQEHSWRWRVININQG